MTSGIDLAGVEAKTARNKSRGSSAIHRSVYLWGGGVGGWRAENKNAVFIRSLGGAWTSLTEGRKCMLQNS